MKFRSKEHAKELGGTCTTILAMGPHSLCSVTGLWHGEYKVFLAWSVRTDAQQRDPGIRESLRDDPRPRGPPGALTLGKASGPRKGKEAFPKQQPRAAPWAWLPLAWREHWSRGSREQAAEKPLGIRESGSLQRRAIQHTDRSTRQ